jgi:hypothetical protein
MTARLKSGLWVAALLRQCSVNGIYGSVLHKGADEAGAVYVVARKRDGTCDFYGPAPGEAYDESGDRRFSIIIATPQAWPDVSARIARLRKNDPDIWVVEIETNSAVPAIKIITE